MGSLWERRWSAIYPPECIPLAENQAWASGSTVSEWVTQRMMMTTAKEKAVITIGTFLEVGVVSKVVALHTLICVVVDKHAFSGRYVPLSCRFVDKHTFLGRFPYLVPSLTSTPFQAVSLILYLRWQTTRFRHLATFGICHGNQPWALILCK